jgi:hypothetical protein
MSPNMVLTLSSDLATNDGDGMGVVGHCTVASLNNGLGQYAGALSAAERAYECPQEIGFCTLVLPELIEAASRSGRAERASDALEQLTKAARASGTEWALGMEARSRALVSAGSAAESYYKEAIARLGRAGVRIELASPSPLWGVASSRESSSERSRRTSDGTRDVRRNRIRGVC